MNAKAISDTLTVGPQEAYYLNGKLALCISFVKSCLKSAPDNIKVTVSLTPLVGKNVRKLVILLGGNNHYDHYRAEAWNYATGKQSPTDSSKGMYHETYLVLKRWFDNINLSTTDKQFVWVKIEAA